MPDTGTAVPRDGKLMDGDSPDAVYFQEKYEWANNWGRVVGFTPGDLLVLHRGRAADSWFTKSIPATAVLRIRVRQFRSIYVLCMGVIASAVAVFVACMGLTGEAIGPGIFTIPVICALFAYYCFRWSMRLHIQFDLDDQKQVYRSGPGSFQETLATIPALVQWARSKNIPVDLETGISDKKGSK